MASERLQKIIAQAGIASRRAAEKFIVDGRVRVNGRPVQELGAKADVARDVIEVEGFGRINRAPNVYVALHKPALVVSTVRDPEGRTTVVDLLARSRAVGERRFEGELPRLFPVGRLDYDAEGIILLTNDGALSHALLHPTKHVPKTYMVKVRGCPTEASLDRLRQGVRLATPQGGLTRPTAPAEVRLVKQARTNAWLELTVFEGRNHQVKRMCDAIKHPTVRLIRTHFGGIGVEPLPAGAWRFLTPGEVEQLVGWRR